MSVNVNTTVNTVTVQDDSKTIIVVDNRLNTSVEVVQNTSNVVTVATPGPQGQKGTPGLDADVTALVTTASFNQFTASYNTGSFSGSFYGTVYGTSSYSDYSPSSSYSATASFAPAYTLSSSFNQFTSSYTANSASFSASIASLTSATSSYTLNSQTSSMSVLSSSFASTASYYVETDPVFTSRSGSFATTGSNAFKGNQTISGSLTMSGSLVFDGGASIRTNFYGAGGIDIVAEPGGYAELSSNNTQSFVWVVNDGAYIGTSWDTHAYQFEFRDDGYFVLPQVQSLTKQAGILSAGDIIIQADESQSWRFSSGSGILYAPGGIEAPSFTGSVHGTSSWAKNSVTASAILGGAINHVPYFITANTLASSSIYQSGSSTIIINQDNATSEHPEALYVWQPSQTSFNVISGKGNLNNYLQLNIQNTNNGASGSSDVVATANNGNESSNYIDMGINNEGYNQNFIGTANDAYLYSTGNHLHIGNVSSFPIHFFVGGSDVDANRKLQLDPNDDHQLTGSLDSTGRIKAPSFTGSLLGSASYATIATTSSYSTVLGASLSQPFNNQVRLLSSNGNTLGTVTVNNVVSASHADQASTADYAVTAGNGGVTQLIAGSGINLIPSSGQGAVTVVSSGGGGVTIISGSLVTGSFINASSYTFNHNLNTRTPIITVFDSNYNQIIPENIQLIDSSSALITFPTNESGFAIGSTGGTTGTAFSSSYALFSDYAQTASYYVETDPIFVAKSGSFATTGSNVFRGNQIVTGSLFTSGSNTLVGNTILSGTLSISGSQAFYGASNFYGNQTLSGSNIVLGDSILSGSLQVSGSTILNNSTFIVTGSTFIKGQTHISGSTVITGSFNVLNGDINIISGSSFTRWGNKLFNYGQFSDTTIQSGSANTAYAMKFNTTDFALNTRIVSGTRITVDNTGIYNLQFSAQVANTANSTITYDIWFAYTGSNIANSNTQTVITKAAGSTGRNVSAWNIATPIQAGDYVEIMWSCDASTMQLQSAAAAAGPSRPAIPSVIATLTQIA